MEEHKSSPGKTSVEENLAKDYVSKGKLGNLQMPNQVDENLKKKMEATQKEIEKFKTELLKKHNLKPSF